MNFTPTPSALRWTSCTPGDLDPAELAAAVRREEVPPPAWCTRSMATSSGAVYVNGPGLYVSRMTYSGHLGGVGGGDATSAPGERPAGPAALASSPGWPARAR